MSRKESPEPPRRKPLLLRWLPAVVLAAAVGGLFWYQSRANPAPVRPNRAEALDANVTALIDRHIEAVEQDRSNAEAHGRLGLAYEVNELFSEAHASFLLAQRLAPHDPVWPYHASIALYSNGQFDPALEILANLSAKHPAFTPAQHRYGVLLTEAGRFDEAEAAFEKTIRLAPETPEGHVGLAQVALERQQHEAAVEHLQKALELDDTYKLAHFLLGQAYRGLGRMEEAQRELALGVDAAKRFIPDRTVLQGESLVAGLAGQLQKAGDLIKGGRAKEAVFLLELAYKDRPDDLNVMNNLAVAYLEDQRYEKSLELLEKVKRVDETQFPAHINTAECYLKLKRPQEALAPAQRAVQLAPDVGQAHYALGRTLLSLGQPHEAALTLKRAVELDTRFPMAYLALAECYMIQQRYDQARAPLEEVTKRIPALLQGHVNLGAVCLRVGDLPAAEEALAKARNISPRNQRVLALAEEVALAKGQ